MGKRCQHDMISSWSWTHNFFLRLFQSLMHCKYLSCKIFENCSCMVLFCFVLFLSCTILALVPSGLHAPCISKHLLLNPNTSKNGLQQCNLLCDELIFHEPFWHVNISAAAGEPKWCSPLPVWLKLAKNKLFVYKLCMSFIYLTYFTYSNKLNGTKLDSMWYNTSEWWDKICEFSLPKCYLSTWRINI